MHLALVSNMQVGPSNPQSKIPKFQRELQCATAEPLPGSSESLGARPKKRQAIALQGRHLPSGSGLLQCTGTCMFQYIPCAEIASSPVQSNRTASVCCQKSKSPWIDAGTPATFFPSVAAGATALLAEPSFNLGCLHLAPPGHIQHGILLLLAKLCSTRKRTCNLLLLHVPRSGPHFAYPLLPLPQTGDFGRNPASFAVFLSLSLSLARKWPPSPCQLELLESGTCSSRFGTNLHLRLLLLPFSMLRLAL
ncbi:hypothetical protein V8C42DRAFT_4554 [Trichoderma barbatum]